MKDIIIREPREDELQLVSTQIAKSYRHTYRDSMDPAYLDSLTDDHWVPILEKSIQRGDGLLIAEQSGKIVGSAVYGAMEGEPGRADLRAIYLQPGFLGKGLGHLLFTASENAMRRRGFAGCALDVLTANKRAVDFYIRHGYTVTDTFEVDENGTTLQCHTMKKDFM